MALELNGVVVTKASDSRGTGGSRATAQCRPALRNLKVDGLAGQHRRVSAIVT
jgi:hypothetical protein